RAVTGFTEQELETAARDLYEELKIAIPRRRKENWNAWPYLRIQISRDSLDNLNALSKEERLSKTQHVLLTEATIVASDSGLPQLFRLSQISPGMKFSELVDNWTEHYPHNEVSWLSIMVEQIAYGVIKQTPDIAVWHHFRHVKSNEESIPGVGRIKGDAVQIEFDIYFYGIAHVPLVTSRMNSLEHMYYIDLAYKPAEDRNLIAILDELESHRWNRIPILENRLAKLVVHTSIVNEYLRKKAYQNQPIADLSLADLLADQSANNGLSKTWDTVPKYATLEEAGKRLKACRGCQDIFITETGSPDEPVIGWLTDHDVQDAIF
ncbi:hypothetical protein C7271_01525, partial [filamentous cyanobacterium CCP5]